MTNRQRNGADYAVYINTGHEFDGSDAGARPDEAVSWGKIRLNSQSVKVCVDATLVFPLIVAETFAKAQQNFYFGFAASFSIRESQFPFSISLNNA